MQYSEFSIGTPVEDHRNNTKTLAKVRGRKQDPRRTEALLDAATELLLEVGFDRFRIQDVADRAGSGTGAIYRRWSSKEALVAEAIRNIKRTPPPQSDDSRDNLRNIVQRECDRFASQPDRVPGLISAMRADADIEAAVREGYSLHDFRAAIEGIIGPDHPHLTILAELTPAILLLRASFAPETLTPEATTTAILSLIEAVARTTGLEGTS